MESDQAPLPQEPVCTICNTPIRAGQDRVTIQQEHYHARCYDRTHAPRRRP
jgi:hypothetical protein